jgi:flagellar protein FlaJ
MSFLNFFLKRDAKKSSKLVSPFDMFYQLTYMSAMSASGLSRSKLFEIAALSPSSAAVYFEAVNTLVNEFRYDYPEACRRVGVKTKSENMKSFLLRLSDALRSGEPLTDFLAREAAVQSEEYENQYERDLESLKQWSNAFISITISVALIVIIQMISSMIYSMDTTVMAMLISSGFLMNCFGAWIIYRSAPQETMTVALGKGSPEQRHALRLLRVLAPVSLAAAALLYVLQIDLGWILIGVSFLILPVGVISLMSDQKISKKDIEFSTFLRSAGSMATSSGTTLKQALTKIDLSSFPILEPDIQRLSKRLDALVAPEICWNKFGIESGSKLVSQVSDIFYSAVKMGGDPERVGYLCSLFVAKASQLRAKRRLIAGTFAALSTIMQAVVAGLMVFVLSIVQNFAILMVEMMPQNPDEMANRPSMNLGMANLSAADLQFLSLITVIMILLLAVVGAAAVVLSSGGYRLKLAFYLGLTLLISGVSFLMVPPMVAGILLQSVS